MPEGPEVYTLAKDMRYLIGKTCDVANVEPDFGARVTLTLPFTITDIGSKGKLLYWRTDRGIVHFYLGLTGGFTCDVSESFIRVRFKFSDDTELYYTDQLKNGSIKEMNAEQHKVVVDGLGPNLIPWADAIVGSNEPRLTPEWELIAKMLTARPKLRLIDFMMNQHMVSGIGNYLKSDIMYEAGIHDPKVRVGDVDPSRLIRAMAETIRDAVANNGSEGYTRLNGARGTYRFRVYGKKKTAKGEPVIRVMVGGRATFYVA